MEVVIDKPDIQVIKTCPTTLGCVDYFMILCEQELSKEIFNEDGYDIDRIWEDNSGNWVADRLRDDDFDLPVFVLHASANQMSDPITFIPELGEGNFFTENVTQYDSSITLHCIAAKRLRSLIHFRTGFHYFFAGYPTKSPTSWETMNMIYQGDYKSIAVDYEAFKHAYEPSKEVWLNALKYLVC